jgi:RNA polymerase sigma factor (sigma-70 family)
MGAGPDDRDDRELLACVADGDSGALRELYTRHAPWLAVRLRGRCNDAEIVGDVVQDTFVAVWRGAGKFRGDGEVGAWLWGIGIRQLVTRLRRQRPLVPPLLGLRADHAPAAEDAVLAGVEYGRLGPALASLSPELQAVVQATILDGLTTREAARLLNIPQGTVKTRAMRARAHLREYLVEGAT